jgi:drug/metabolite transporter (DMT)-like permease
LNWVFAALGSATVFAFVSVIDKRILSAHVSGFVGFSVIVGALQFVMVVVAFLIGGWQHASAHAILLSGLSGILWGSGLFAFFYGLNILDVTRAVPVFHTFPVFVAGFSVLFMGEQLVWLHWVAILAIVGGAGLAAVGQETTVVSGNTVLGFLMVLLGSVGTAGGTITTSLALEEMAFWNVFSVRALFLGLVLFAPVFHRVGFYQTGLILRTRKSLALIVVTEGPVVMLAIYLTLLALDLGSVSLVSALMGTRPVIVLLITTLLSSRPFKMFNEIPTGRMLEIKLTSAVLVVSGAAVLSLV